MNVAGPAIKLIRDLVRHVNSSASRIQAFNEIAERECFPTKVGLVLDVPNRWNSTHGMILEAVEYKIVLKRYATSQQQPFLTEDEWSKAESIGKFLGVFEETTKAFTVDRFSTAHLFLVNVLYIHQALRTHTWQHQVIKELAKSNG
ncbi:zinc finger BED domain-containing protein RICESLEEPER 2-like [Panicum miliaceum]|uniref:Zinc finger BED domain-containing protein RICESLEEPER 2-like n=1 Tax=Panicum miliaceum TaxID=4540 RepID=A0A3L6PR38_PANMI|nr:zinc finger BED domain-containing protein RICESLEEPER 2-like [Panicum miliaceum]